MPDYSCADFVLRSEIPLPELIEAGTATRHAVVTVQRNAVVHEGPPGLRRDGKGVTFAIPGVARFRVEDGASIVVDADPQCSARNLRLFLLGSALGVVLHQRGLFPLHANAVVIDGRAVAFTGASGAGKSTLAAWFAGRGYPVLCDDVCVIGLSGEGRPVVYPGLPRVKLWADALVLNGHSIDGLDRVHDDLDKYQLSLPVDPRQAPVPLGAVLRLKRQDDRPARVERLRGGAAVRLLMEETYRPAIIPVLDRQQAHFEHCTAIASAVPIMEWMRRWGHEVFESEVDALMGRLEGLGIRGAEGDEG